MHNGGYPTNCSASPDETSLNKTEQADYTCTTKSEHDCSEGLVLPPWLPPSSEIDLPNKIFRTFVYLMAYAYLLYGTAILTERLSSSIEVIVSQKRTVCVTVPQTGKRCTIRVPIWHPAVSLLTIFAIGTSCGEIFLPLVAVVKAGFTVGESGPAVVLSSTACHVFCIFALCLIGDNDKAGKPIENLASFFVKTFFLLGGYVFGIIALNINPGVATIKEGLLTLAAFPVIVFTTWSFEYRLHVAVWQKLKSLFRINDGTQNDSTKQVSEEQAAVEDEERRRRELTAMLQELRTAHPAKSMFELEEMAERVNIEKMARSAAFHRVEALREISGKESIISPEINRKQLARRPATVSSSKPISIGKNKIWVVPYDSEPNTRNYSAAEKPHQTSLFAEPPEISQFQFVHMEVIVTESEGWARVRVLRTEAQSSGAVSVSFKVLDGSARANQHFRLPNSQEVAFHDGQTEAFIEIEILPCRNSDNQPLEFSVQLDCAPQSQATIRIVPDTNLEPIVERLLQLSEIADLICLTSWSDQFSEAVALPQRHRTPTVYLIHVLSLPWKLLSALIIPPAHYFNGWLSYFVSVFLIIFVSALITDVAKGFGCAIGLKYLIVIYVLVGPGLSLPSALASRHAALHEKTADAAIGHITGSNAVSYFLSIGLVVTVCTSYHMYKGEKFKMPTKNLAAKATAFCVLAVVAIAVILLRRLPPIRGELGGPRSIRLISAFILMSLWVIFISLLALEAYCIIDGF